MCCKPAIAYPALATRIRYTPPNSTHLPLNSTKRFLIRATPIFDDDDDDDDDDEDEDEEEDQKKPGPKARFITPHERLKVLIVPATGNIAAGQTRSALCRD